MYGDFQKHLQGILTEIKEAGLYKNERVIITPQSSAIQVEGGKKTPHGAGSVGDPVAKENKPQAGDMQICGP